MTALSRPRFVFSKNFQCLFSILVMFFFFVFFGLTLGKFRSCTVKQFTNKHGLGRPCWPFFVLSNLQLLCSAYFFPYKFWTLLQKRINILFSYRKANSTCYSESEYPIRSHVLLEFYGEITAEKPYCVQCSIEISH